MFPMLTISVLRFVDVVHKTENYAKLLFKCTISDTISQKKEEYDANYQLLCLILYLSALPIIELFYGTSLQSGGKFKMVKMLNVDTIFYISSIIFNQFNFYTKSYSS